MYQIKNIVVLVMLLFVFVESKAVELNFESSSNIVMEDAVLFTSTSGTCDYETIAIGDLNLTQTDYHFELDLSGAINKAWLLARIGSDVVYTSPVAIDDQSFDEIEPFNIFKSNPDLSIVDVFSELSSFTEKTVKVRIGVMADTHYYRNADGSPHPLEVADPFKYDLTASIEKMQAALDLFVEKEADFAVILGDMVEDHAGWNGDVFTANAALNSNLGDLGNLFDQYEMPVHLVLGNHDTGFGTTRTDLYNTLSYYSQENYDGNDYASRMDYTFDVNGIRFIAFDNVGHIPVSGKVQGYRWASAGTLAFLKNELFKVSDIGSDAGMPVVLMSHARVDCLSVNNCNQKINLVDSNKFQWTQSKAGTNEFYLEALGGGVPDIYHTDENFNQFVWLAGKPLSLSGIGNLVEDSWNYGNNPIDTISFNTVYIRFSDAVDASYDPDDATTDYIQYKYVESGMSENYEEQRVLFENAYDGGSNILAVLQGHHHISDKNAINGIDYYTFSSHKTSPVAHAVVDVLYDNSIYIEGFGKQVSYNLKKPYHEYHDCMTGEGQINSVLWDYILKNHVKHEVTTDYFKPTVTSWQFNPTAKKISSLAVNLQTSGTVYESAQDEKTIRWYIFDNDPPGATITNVFDIELNSRVINFEGASWTNGYSLRSNLHEEWRNGTKFKIGWKMKFDDTYIIRVKVKTSEGNKYLRYTAIDTDLLGTESTVNLGLGSGTQDGRWRSIVRDLQSDLALAQPGIDILEVNAFYIRGSGRVDDVKLYSELPFDTDSDGIVDTDEVNVYFTDPRIVDSDSDGIDDGSEILYWSLDWNTDSDGDGLVNLIDTDSDNDGISDGEEIEMGSDPSDISSNPWGVSTVINFDVLTTGSGGLDLIVDGDVTYLAAERQGLYILDTSDLSDITVMHHLPQSEFGISGFSLYSIVKDGEYLYCGFRRTSGDLDGYLKVVNLGETADVAPYVEINDLSFEGGTSNEGRLTGLFLDSSLQRLFASLRLGGIASIDISNPSEPALLGIFDSGAVEHQQVIVDSNHNRAYFGAWYRGLGAIDISDPDPATWQEYITDDSNANDRYWYLTQKDQYLYVPIADSPSDNSFDEGLAVYNLTDNFSDASLPPKRVGFAVIPPKYQCESAEGGKDEGLEGGDPGPHQITLKGDYAIVANGCMGIAIFNIVNPENPFFVRAYEIPGQVDWPWSVVVTGNKILTVGRNKNDIVNNDIYVFDIIPEAFSFVDKLNVPLNEYVYSNEVTMNKLPLPSTISIKNGEYSINGDEFTNVAGMVVNGDTVLVRQLSSPNYNVTTESIVTIADISNSFLVLSKSKSAEVSRSSSGAFDLGGLLLLITWAMFFYSRRQL